ncbi:unnamed protein product [Phaeothamnion confervicola]
MRSAVFLVLSLSHHSDGFVSRFPVGLQRCSAHTKSIHLQMKAEEMDVVERLFANIFGKREESPVGLGLGRINPENYPDQYPAIKGVYADPVKGDDRTVTIFRPLLKQTDLEKRQLKLVYDSKSNGFSAAAFHRGVDKKGPAVIFARTKGGAVCGGYNPKGFVGLGEYRPGISAFLFTWPDGDISKPATKLRKVGGAGLAVIDTPENGPQFGSDGFCARMERDREKMAGSKLGSYYERMPDGTKFIFAAAEGGVAELTELKAFVGVYAPGEQIPFDDAIPFSIT